MSELKEPDQKKWDSVAPLDEDAVAQAKFQKKIEKVVEREEAYEKNRTAVFSIVFGQCSSSMKAQLEGQEDWKSSNRDHDLVNLLKSVKVYMINQQSSKCLQMGTISATKSLFKVYQGAFEELVDFKEGSSP